MSHGSCVERGLPGDALQPRRGTPSQLRFQPQWTQPSSPKPNGLGATPSLRLLRSNSLSKSGSNPFRPPTEPHGHPDRGRRTAPEPPNLTTAGERSIFHSGQASLSCPRPNSTDSLRIESISPQSAQTPFTKHLGQCSPIPLHGYSLPIVAPRASVAALPDSRGGWSPWADTSVRPDRASHARQARARRTSAAHGHDRFQQLDRRLRLPRE